MFSGVVVTMQYRLSCNFIEIYVKFNMAAAIYNVDCFRFVGRHLELLVMSHHHKYWVMSFVVSDHQNCWKPHENMMSCNISTWFSKSTRFLAKFQSRIRVSGRHIGFPVQHRTTIFMAICSPAISRKSHQTVSLYSKRFGNAIEKIGLGGKFTPLPIAIGGLKYLNYGRFYVPIPALASNV